MSDNRNINFISEYLLKIDCDIFNGFVEKFKIRLIALQKDNFARLMDFLTCLFP